MSNMDTSPFTDEEGDTFTHEGGTPSREKGLEVLASRRVNNKEVLEGCESPISLPSSDAYIVNPFLRQSIHDALNTDSDPKESCAKEKVQKEPSETYLCFLAFASTYERLAGVTYPSDKGNYIMSAKDGANCKKLVTWLKKVSASEQAPVTGSLYIIASNPNSDFSKLIGYFFDNTSSGERKGEIKQQAKQVPQGTSDAGPSPTIQMILSSILYIFLTICHIFNLLSCPIYNNLSSAPVTAICVAIGTIPACANYDSYFLTRN